MTHDEWFKKMWPTTWARAESLRHDSVYEFKRNSEARQLLGTSRLAWAAALAQADAQSASATQGASK